MTPWKPCPFRVEWVFWGRAPRVRREARRPWAIMFKAYGLKTDDFPESGLFPDLVGCGPSLL